MKKLIYMNLSNNYYGKVITAISKIIDYKPLKDNKIPLQCNSLDKFYIIIKGSMNILKTVPHDEKMTQGTINMKIRQD